MVKIEFNFFTNNSCYAIFGEDSEWRVTTFFDENLDFDQEYDFSKSLHRYVISIAVGDIFTPKFLFFIPKNGIKTKI